MVFNTAAALTPPVIEESSKAFGSQSIVVSMDVATGPGGKRTVMVEGAGRPVDDDPVAYAKRIVGLGAGEILLNSIDRDGTMEGYDLDLIGDISRSVPVPVIACGGAGNADDLIAAIRTGGAAAAAAGSLFVFYGRLRAVLVNPPGVADLGEAWRRFDAAGKSL